MMYTQQQIDEANKRNLVDFLWCHGESLEKSGREYRWKRHDSVTIQGNRWYQHSRNRGGYPVEFVEEFYGVTFPEAVGLLLEDEEIKHAEPVDIPKPPFVLPPKDETGENMRRYLLRDRKLKPDIVGHFVKAGDLYEDAVHHNVVFVGRDHEHVPQFACVRGTKDQFRMDIAGSNKAYGFAHVGTNKRLLVFEAAIDLMSFASLFDTWKECSLVSLDGVSPKAMVQFIANHPEIEEVFICLDNDEAGRLASIRLMDMVPLRCSVAQLIPRLKDWNEVLCDPSEDEQRYTIGIRREALAPECRDHALLSIDEIPMPTVGNTDHVPILDDEDYEKLNRMEDEMMANDLAYQNNSVPVDMQQAVLDPIPWEGIPVHVSSVRMICLNDVEQTDVQWLWFPYIPFGKITCMLGNPGCGKTYATMDLIAACTNGKLLPGMKQEMEPFNVIYQTAEDGLGDTVKPRLEAVGADLTRVFTIEDTDASVTLIDERVERAITENNVKLCVFDPIQAFLGANVDMNRANEVRPIFARLCKVAERTGCAILFIGHLNKANGQQSLQRGLGSIDIVAAMRSVLVVGKLKKDPDIRVMAHEKSSLAPNGTSLAFRMDDDDGLVWLGEYDVTADDLVDGIDGKEDKKEETKCAFAQNFVRELLAEGKEISCMEMDRLALKMGIPSRTLRDACKKMGTELVSWYPRRGLKMFKLAV